jgi:tRNA (pseudouridine54-N1)-methyltransferase
LNPGSESQAFGHNNRRRSVASTRTFVLKASEAHTSDDFKLKDLPSSSGRLDVVCRCSIAALLDDLQIRKDSIFIGVLEGKPNAPLCLRLDGRELRMMPFSEIGMADMLRRILGGHYEHGREYAIPYWQGVSIERKSFAELLCSVLASNALHYLCEEGEDIRTADVDMKRDNVFVLGDQQGLTVQDEEILEKLGAKRISLGSLSYLSSQVITLVHDELDRRLSKT